jgi:hypothetical protein
MRPRAVLTTAAMLAVAGAFAGPAHAVVTPGPLDPNTTLPATMSDGTTTLALCADGSAFCTSIPPHPADPVSVPGNFDPSGEAFWMLGMATMGVGDAEFALEAAFLGDIAPNQGSVFGRIRYRMNLTAGTYRIRHPFGTSGPYTVAGPGTRSLNVTEDVPDVSNISGIIQWDAGAPAGYIGDPAQPHAIKGAPTGLNAVVVEKLVPGDPALGIADSWTEVDSTTQFALEGKTSDGTVPAAVPFIGVNTNAVAFAPRRADQVSGAKTLIVNNNGAAPLNITGVTRTGPDAGAFSATGCVGTLAARTSCTITVGFPGGTTVGDKSATLNIASDGVNAATVPVALSGAVSGLGPAPQAPAGQTPAGQAPAVGQAPAGAGTPTTTTITRVVPGIGPAAPAAPSGVAVQGTVARPLAVSSVALAQRISLTRLRAQGLRLSMRVQQGTRVVRIAVYRAKSNGSRTGAALFAGYHLPASAGLFRVTLRGSLVRKLRAGRYVVEVQPGQSRTSLGALSRHRFLVTR